MKRTQNMSTATLLVISVLVCLVHAQKVEVPIEETLQRGAIAMETLRRALDEKLPPSAEAHQEGSEILASFQQSLKTCEAQLRKNQLVSEYNTCVGTFQGLALASIGELAGQHWAKSGASRPTLFW
ncbi:uncharacterized protein [Drosophila virilis]|uniref:Protein TsetseEP domain-containing protein n=1 Tax=Drosophila virilis TaxID=7244 RepID=B4MC12_DROVI|nr:uncharacterized protein LOC6635105 [Drosophila virilis]EDW58633.2 uncharacterized protein Dvir_GJ14187 [Drosophila virilis]